MQDDGGGTGGGAEGRRGGWVEGRTHTCVQLKDAVFLVRIPPAWTALHRVLRYPQQLLELLFYGRTKELGGLFRSCPAVILELCSEFFVVFSLLLPIRC